MITTKDSLRVLGVEKYAEIINKSTQRAMDLLVNLLEWSLSQTGKMVFNPEYVEIGSMINETIELLDNATEQKSITISRELPQVEISISDNGVGMNEETREKLFKM